MNEERAHLQTIDERDAAEEAMSQAYYLVTGNSPQWSNMFGYPEALEDIGDALALLKASLKAADPGAWRDISSAPKDGTHFLACDARVPYGPQWSFNHRPPTVVHWWGSPGEEGFYTSVNELEPQKPFEATHWQPLCAPPTRDSGCV